MAEVTPEELRDSLRINKNDLDGELVVQSNHVYHSGMLFVRALSARDHAKETYKRVHARLMKELYPIVKGELGKAPAEKTMLAAVEVHQEYVAARDSFMELNLVADEAQVLKEAVKDKGFAMHNLVELVTSEAVSIGGASEGPKLSKDERKARREKTHKKRESRRSGGRVKRERESLED